VYMEYPSAMTLAWFLFWIIAAYVLSGMIWNARHYYFYFLKKEASVREENDFV